MENTDSCTLEILTMGNFLLEHNNTLFSLKALRSNKTWELFKFLLSHRGKYLPPETILENLWPEKEYADPKATLRVQIKRMKQAIGEELFTSDKLNLHFSHGCYCLKTGNNCRLDIEVMEKLSQQASYLSPNMPEKAIEVYYKAISLYKGDYFPSLSYQGWVLLFRNYYRRLYLTNLLKLLELLKNKGLNQEIIKLCEKSFFIELFEENIHLYYMEALIKEKQEKQALAHYQYITSLMYREIGTKPSETMRSIYRLINSNLELPETDLSQLQEILKEHEEGNGALICDPEFFRLLYRLKKRWSQRTKQKVALGMLTLSGNNHTPFSGNQMAESIVCLKQVLLKSLRKGDVVSRWNDFQFILLLPESSQGEGIEILKRIEKRFYESNNSGGTILRSKVQILST